MRDHKCWHCLETFPDEYLWQQHMDTHKPVEVGDVVQIVSHRYFPGGSILPIGSKFIVKKVITVPHVIDGFQYVIVYQWNRKSNTDWWIIPPDYKIISRR